MPIAVTTLALTVGQSRETLEASRSLWSNTTQSTAASSGRDTTRIMETARRHALENHDKDLRVVQELELRLEIQERWTIGSTEWQKASQLVAMRKYQRALDVLEGLIVARMFELTKMNRSQTGELTRLHEGRDTGALTLWVISDRIRPSETYRQVPERTLPCYPNCAGAL